MFQTKRQKKLAVGLFGAYLLLLVWLVLFKFQINVTELDSIRNINIIPFSASMIVNGKISFKEIMYNVFVFIPLGIYVSMFKPKWSFIQKVVPCLGLSLSFEVLQFIFAIGASDITDLIGNTFGGILGVALYALLQKIFKAKTVTVINVAAALVLAFAIFVLGILILANM